MATQPSLRIDLTTPTCISWEVDNTTTQRLIETDPPTRHLQFECHFDDKTTSASFKIHCPIRVKGVDSHSHLLVLIPTTAITSFAFKPYPTSPEDVMKKLNCSTIRLRFTLDQPLHLVAPAAAAVPVLPRKRLSAEVFDHLRSLARATLLDVYVSDRDLPHSKLNAVREAVAQSLLKPFNPSLANALTALYGGRGGRLTDLLLPQTDNPPAYDELEPPPPPALELVQPEKTEQPAPVVELPESNGKKRRRLDELGSSGETATQPHVPWATFVDMWQGMRQEMDNLVKRVEHLEKENKELRDEVDVLRGSCEQATEDVHADEVALLEVRNDLDELEDRVDYLAQNGMDSDVEESLLDKVTSRAVTSILERKYKLCIDDT